MLDWKEPLPFDGLVDRGMALFQLTLPRAYPLAAGVALVTNLAIQTGLDGRHAELDALLKAGDLAAIGDRFGGLCLAIGALSLLLGNAVLHLIGTLARDHPGDAFTSLGAALRAFPQLLIAVVLLTLATAAGLMLFIVPGVVIALMLSFSGQAVLFDGHDGLRALGVSFKRMRGNLWRTLAFYLLIFVASLLASLASGAVVGVTVAIAKLVGVAPLAPYLELLLGSAIGAALALAIDAMLVVWYFDLGVRAGDQPRLASFAA